MSVYRDRFDRRGFGVKKYARSIGVSHSTLSLFLDGKLKIKNRDRAPKYRKMVEALARDGVLDREVMNEG